MLHQLFVYVRSHLGELLAPFRHDDVHPSSNVFSPHKTPQHIYDADSLFRASADHAGSLPLFRASHY